MSADPDTWICMPCNPALRHFIHHERCLRYRPSGPACACPAKYHDNPSPPDAYRGALPAETWPART